MKCSECGSTLPAKGSLPGGDWNDDCVTCCLSAGVLHTYTLYWSPEGRPIATVYARSGWEARKQAPQPYRKAIGEVYSVRHDLMSADERESLQRRGFGAKPKTDRTRVIFRLHGSEVVALFPDLPATASGSSITCYAHLGQHSAADYFGVVRNSRPATPAEYAPLKRELESIGYVLDVRTRRSRKGNR